MSLEIQNRIPWEKVIDTLCENISRQFLSELIKQLPTAVPLEIELREQTDNLKNQIYRQLIARETSLNILTEEEARSILFKEIVDFCDPKEIIPTSSFIVDRDIDSLSGTLYQDDEVLDAIGYIKSDEFNHIISLYGDDIDFNEIKFLINKSIEDVKPKILTTPQEIYLLNEVDIELYKALITHPSLLKTLDWRLFEKLLADILATFEYEVDLQRGTKDGGVDIIAIKKSTPLGDHKYLVQAKRWKNKVGVEPVRSLAYLHGQYGASKSCLVTTSTFTKGALEIANLHKWKLELRDADGILDWLQQAAKIKGL